MWWCKSCEGCGLFESDALLQPTIIEDKTDFWEVRALKEKQDDRYIMWKEISRMKKWLTKKLKRIKSGL